MTNRFFKAVDINGSLLDIVVADNQSDAEVAMMFKSWHNVFFQFDVVECSRKEWVVWWRNGR